MKDQVLADIDEFLAGPVEPYNPEQPEIGAYFSRLFRTGSAATKAMKEEAAPRKKVPVVGCLTQRSDAQQRAKLEWLINPPPPLWASKQARPRAPGRNTAATSERTPTPVPKPAATTEIPPTPARRASIAKPEIIGSEILLPGVKIVRKPAPTTSWYDEVVAEERARARSPPVLHLPDSPMGISIAAIASTAVVTNAAAAARTRTTPPGGKPPVPVNINGRVYMVPFYAAHKSRLYRVDADGFRHKIRFDTTGRVRSIVSRAI